MFYPMIIENTEKGIRYTESIENLLVPINACEEKEMRKNLELLEEDIVHIYHLVESTYEKKEYDLYMTEKQLLKDLKPVRRGGDPEKQYDLSWIDFVVANHVVIQSMEKYGEPGYLPWKEGAPSPFVKHMIAIDVSVNYSFGEGVYTFYWDHYKNQRSLYVRFRSPFVDAADGSRLSVTESIKSVHRDTKTGYRFLIGLSEDRKPILHLHRWEQNLADKKEYYLCTDRDGSIYWSILSNLVVDENREDHGRKRKKRKFFHYDEAHLLRCVAEPPIMPGDMKNQRRFYTFLIHCLLFREAAFFIRVERTINGHYSALLNWDVGKFYTSELNMVMLTDLEFFHALLYSACYVTGIQYEQSIKPGERAICAVCGKSSKETKFQETKFVCGPKAEGGRCGKYWTRHRSINLINYMICDHHGVFKKVDPLNFVFPFDQEISNLIFEWKSPEE